MPATRRSRDTTAGSVPGISSSASRSPPMRVSTRYSPPFASIAPDWSSARRRCSAHPFPHVVARAPAAGPPRCRPGSRAVHTGLDRQESRASRQRVRRRSYACRRSAYCGGRWTVRRRSSPVLRRRSADSRRAQPVVGIVSRRPLRGDSDRAHVDATTSRGALPRAGAARVRGLRRSRPIPADSRRLVDA